MRYANRAAPHTSIAARYSRALMVSDLMRRVGEARGFPTSTRAREAWHVHGCDHASHPTVGTGNVTATVVPVPTALSTAMSPRCRATNSLHSASPRDRRRLSGLG